MKFKKLTKSVLCIAMVFMMTACGGAGGTSQSTDNAEDGQINLRMAWWGSQARHDATVEVIRLYESQNPHIKIDPEFYTFDGYFTNLNTLVAANDVWDIFQMGGNFPVYLDSIYPINEFIESGIIDVSDTTEAFLSTTRSDGVQLGLSNGVNTYGIAYDPAMFEAAGIPEPPVNWTWDDYRDISLQITERLGVFGSSKLEDFNAGASMGISQEGFDLNFFAETNDRLGFDDPSMLVKYFQIRKELVDAKAYPDPGRIAEIRDIEGDFLVTGEAAMTWVASNQFPILSEAAGRELRLTTVPRKTSDGPSGSIVQSSQMMSISQNSDHKEEAAKFINFFANSEEANAILNGERGVPIMQNIRDLIEANASPDKKVVFDFVSLVGTFPVGIVNVLSPPQTPQIEDYYDLLIQQVVFGEKTPEEAAQEIFDFAASRF